MTTKVEVAKNPHRNLGKRPTYLVELIEKFKTWSGIDDMETDEAIKYLSSDLYTEIRKCESLIYTFIDDWPTLKEKAGAEELKEFIKARIREMWRDMVEKQKIGIDKLGILVRKNLSTDNLLKQNHGSKTKKK